MGGIIYLEYVVGGVRSRNDGNKFIGKKTHHLELSDSINPTKIRNKGVPYLTHTGIYW